MNRKIKQAATLGFAATAFAFGLRSYNRRQKRIAFDGQVVVITGGSCGLGLEIARLFAQEGARLALLAREAEELRQAEQELLAADAEIMVLPCDIRDQGQVDAALDRIVRRYGRLDLLVNCAGIIQVAPMQHMQLEDYQEAMDVHFWGPFYTIQKALEFMRRQKRGRIINISSIGGEVAVPHLLPYSASKFALVGLSDGMRAELAREGIQVTTVTPGLMRTGSHVNALFKGRHRLEYAWFSIMDALPVASTDSRRAARQVVEAARYGDPYLVITFQAKLLVFLRGAFPGLIAAGMKMMNLLLPRPEKQWGDLVRSGWDSQSRWSPSFLTVLSDKAVVRNNELRGHAPILPEESEPLTQIAGD
jgi:NAD(P)-dependent dehydrogenase (short-subunit alcohol dehydrogenase family)